MRVHLTTLGCRLNEAELERWSRDFQSRGHVLARAPDEADVVVVNTCAVTDEAVRKSRKLVRRAQRANPVATLVVSGCYASLEPHAAAAELAVDVLVPNVDKDRLVDIVSRRLEVPAVPLAALAPDVEPLLARGRQRAFVKVQDGCRHRCSYCVVTLARGEERSRPVAEVVAEVEALHARGIREVALTGVHLGGYGSDSGTDLRALVDAVLRETSVPRVRLGSLEPWDLPDGFWELFAKPRLMPHLHLPMQSGADSVLRRMARRCRTDEFRRLAAAARAAVPGMNLTTDIIVGFPGETEDEWEQTLRFVEGIGFGQIHVFPYSPRPGTKAATLPEQVDEETKRRRSRELQELAARLRREALEAAVGRRFEVLVEGEGTDAGGGERAWEGYTPSFLRCAFVVPATQDLCNRVIEVETTGVSGDGERLLARLG
jgi:threonylcarbamoyladenosine tRNA methylthiotransferase MtaB